MKYYLIYKITNLLNNKVYIGKHETVNLNDGYMGSGTLIKKAVLKYGIENFKKEILYYCSSRDEMNKIEEELVNEEFCKRKDTYNINTGGFGGWYYINSHNLQGNGEAGRKSYLLKLKDPTYHEQFCRKIKDSCTEEVRLKISSSIKEHIKKHGHSWLGRKHTEYTKQKMRNTFQSHTHQQGIKNSQYGHIWVYNEELMINKSIKREDFEIYEKNGYKKGRKMSFK